MVSNDRITCVIVWVGVGELQGSWRFDPSPNALQKWKERVPVISAVDVGSIGFKQLMQAKGHLSTDSGQDVRLHHQQQAKREENLCREGEEHRLAAHLARFPL